MVERITQNEDELIRLTQSGKDQIEEVRKLREAS